MAWDDDKKAQAVSMYEDQDPTPETSMEIVKAIAEELEESPNGVRMILTKAGVYVKKSPASGGSKTGTSGGSGGGRVSKAAAQDTRRTVGLTWWCWEVGALAGGAWRPRRLRRPLRT